MLFWSRSGDEEARYLSNFQPCPISVGEDFPVECMRGLTFPSVEHAFQAAKLGFSSGDPGAKLQELRSPIPPVLAKKAGTRAAWTRFGLVLDTAAWGEACLDVMERLVAARAASDPRFVEIATRAGELRHYERFGGFWGCRRAKTGEWVGENHLGKIIHGVTRRHQARPGAEPWSQ